MDLIEQVQETVGSGWHPIGVALHHDLVVLDPNYRVGQVKEKFAGLRVHIDVSEGTPDNVVRAIHDLCSAAYGASLRVCELCGKPGTQRNTGGREYGYLVTRCPDCPDRWGR